MSSAPSRKAPAPRPDAARPAPLVTRFALSALSLVALLAGCAADVRIDEAALRRSAPMTVAVLPFHAADPDVGGDRAALEVEVVREVTARRFSTLRYLHMEEDMVDRLLLRAGLSDPAALARTPAPRLGAILGVDAILRGQVTDLVEVRAGVLERRVIGAVLTLVDARSGETLCTIRHEEALTVGLFAGDTALVDAIQKPLEASMDRGFLRLAEVFAENALAHLPPPPTAPRIAPPEIASATVTAAPERPLSPGDRVRVTLRGTPGAIASFDAGSFAREVPLHETAPGRYEGSYRVSVGDRGEGPVEVHLQDRFGAPAARILREAQVRVVAAAPAEGRRSDLIPTRDAAGRWRLEPRKESRP